MFTGLVRGVGRVRGIAPSPDGVRLTIDPPAGLAAPQVGASIALDGCCLTLAEAVGEGGAWAFDVVPQTLDVTTLGGLEEGRGVNIEPSLRAGDELGGHMVQGHIDGRGEVTNIETTDQWRITFRVDPALMPMLVPKGSVCVAGVSLTVASVDAQACAFDVALIPTTLRETTLGDLRVGHEVNIETDIFARTIVQYLRHYAGGKA